MKVWFGLKSTNWSTIQSIIGGRNGNRNSKSTLDPEEEEGNNMAPELSTRRRYGHRGFRNGKPGLRRCTIYTIREGGGMYNPVQSGVGFNVWWMIRQRSRKDLMD